MELINPRVNISNIMVTRSQHVHHADQELLGESPVTSRESTVEWLACGGESQATNKSSTVLGEYTDNDQAIMWDTRYGIIGSF